MSRYIAPLLIGVLGAAILAALGVWQLQRLSEKSAQIGSIQARLALPPGPLDARPRPESHAYQAVRLVGGFAAGELHVLTSEKPQGPGFRIIAPFRTAEGRTILVDRGFVPEAEKDLERPRGIITLEGNLVWPRETDIFTPEPDLPGNFWFARDVELMARALGTEPIMVQASAATGTGSPRPLPVTVNIPNNHLQYAVTWFSLAVVWVAMTVLWVGRLHRPAAA